MNNNIDIISKVAVDVGEDKFVPKKRIDWYKVITVVLGVFVVVAVIVGVSVNFVRNRNDKTNIAPKLPSVEKSEIENEGKTVQAKKYPLEDVLKDFPKVDGIKYNVSVDNSSVLVNNSVEFRSNVPLVASTSVCSLYNAFEFCYLGKGGNDFGVYFFANPKDSATFKNIIVKSKQLVDNGVKVLFDMKHKGNNVSGVLVVNNKSMGVMLLPFDGGGADKLFDVVSI